MRLAIALIVLGLLGVVAPAGAAGALELRVDAKAERVEAIVPGMPKREPLLLHDLDRDRRVPALEVTTDARGLVAVFDLRMLSPDGKSHALALEWEGTELARGSAVLPAGDEASRLRWLVVVGPLLGLVMMAAAIWVGRRIVVKARGPRSGPLP